MLPPLSQVAVIRTISAVETLEMYEETPDYWVFGTLHGLEQLADQLSSGEWPCLTLPPYPSSNGCQCSFRRMVGSLAKLRFLERLYLLEGVPAMELVVLGTTGGFLRLAEQLRHSARSLEDAYDHTHLSYVLGEMLVRRNVEITLRGPLADFSRESVHPYDHMIYNAAAKCLPANAAGGGLPKYQPASELDFQHLLE